MYKYHTELQMHFKSITLLIQDMRRSLAFYVDILGLRIKSQEARKSVLTANGEDPLITLIEDRNALPIEITQGLYHFALLLPSRSALALVLKELMDKRYPISGASDHGVSEAIYLDDPDGNGIEIYRDIDEALWPMENGKMTMYTKALNIPEVMKELLLVDSYEVDPNMILGHLHFHVGNLKDAENFFCKAVGFQLMFSYMKSAVFVSDQGYHHHLGLNTWNGDAPLNKEKQVGLKSYVLFVPKSLYPAFSRRLTENRISLLTDGNQKYLVDILNQRMIIEVQ
ncbi:MAG: VOC family protein [Acholeplasmataceae bacterium]|nr:VOC family protein [Acholeplasmataceae bacterium]